MGTGGVTIIALPWPAKELTPNYKRNHHWRKYRPFEKAYRHTCWALTLEAKASGRLLTVTFNPPDRRKRDDDGMIGSFKNGRDGVADALGCDDHTFRPEYRIGNPTKGGRVLVEIGGGQ